MKYEIQQERVKVGHEDEAKDGDKDAAEFDVLITREAVRPVIGDLFIKYDNKDTDGCDKDAANKPT